MNGLIYPHKRGDNIDASNIVSFGAKHLGQIWSMSSVTVPKQKVTLNKWSIFVYTSGLGLSVI